MIIHFYFTFSSYVELKYGILRYIIIPDVYLLKYAEFHVNDNQRKKYIHSTLMAKIKANIYET